MRNETGVRLFDMLLNIAAHLINALVEITVLVSRRGTCVVDSFVEAACFVADIL